MAKTYRKMRKSRKKRKTRRRRGGIKRLTPKAVSKYNKKQKQRRNMCAPLQTSINQKWVYGEDPLSQRKTQNLLRQIAENNCTHLQGEMAKKANKVMMMREHANKQAGGKRRRTRRRHRRRRRRSRRRK